MALKVTAPLVTAVAENGRVVYLYRGDTVPDGVTDDSLKNLKSLGFVADEAKADELNNPEQGGEVADTEGAEDSKPRTRKTAASKSE